MKVIEGALRLKWFIIFSVRGWMGKIIGRSVSRCTLSRPARMLDLSFLYGVFVPVPSPDSFVDPSFPDESVRVNYIPAVNNHGVGF